MEKTAALRKKSRFAGAGEAETWRLPIRRLVYRLAGDGRKCVQGCGVKTDLPWGHTRFARNESARGGNDCKPRRRRRIQDATLVTTEIIRYFRSLAYNWADYFQTLRRILELRRLSSGIYLSYGENSMVDCSISILTKNEGANIGSCLEAVFAQDFEGSFEINLVDSGSTDATLEIAQGYPIRIERIHPREFHHARTRNLAARLGKGPILINLSGDAIPASKNWLSSMLANFRDASVGAVYGRQLPKPGSTIERTDTFDTVYGETRVVKDPAHRNGLGYRFYHFSDVNSALRRSVWEANPYPEDLKMFEDVAIAKRILDAGWKIVYEPEAPVYHSHQYSAKQLFKRYFDIGYTLKELDIWDAPGTRSSLVRDFRKLVGKQFKRAAKSDGQQAERAAMGQSFAKSAGFLLGLNQRFLPLALKRHLSSYGAFE